MCANGGTPFNILAQLTPLPAKTHAQPEIQGSSVSDYEKLKKRARAKYIGDTIKVQLMRIKSPLRNSYLRSLTCASVIHQEDKTLTARYCNSRWCLVCSRIRTAKAINGYYEQLNAIPQLHFLTLTIPNVRAHQLKKAVEDMAATWRHIINKTLKKSRFKDEKINGVRKLEVTYNLVRGDYHPHYHIIIDSGDIGSFILDNWLKRYPLANKVAQDIRPVNNDEREKSLLELFKYSTKFHAKIEEANGEASTKISTFHLDRIFRAIQGKRTYQPYGNIRKVSEDVEDLASEEIVSIQPHKTVHFWSEHDWWDYDGGAALSGYEPSEHDNNLKEAICLIKTVSKSQIETINEHDTIKKPAPRRNFPHDGRKPRKLGSKAGKPRNR